MANKAEEIIARIDAIVNSDEDISFSLADNLDKIETFTNELQAQSDAWQERFERMSAHYDNEVSRIPKEREMGVHIAADALVYWSKHGSVKNSIALAMLIAAANDLREHATEIVLKSMR